MNPSSLRSPLLDPCPAQLPGDGRLILAFSGGADSTALASLIATSGQQREIVCVHVDHGLDPGSGDRAEAARSIVERLSLAFRLERVQVSSGSNREAAARHARYAALKKHVQKGDCLLTAHHADDQVETIFLRLLRGSGPAGLAGIPRQRPFGSGWLARPLLDWTRSELQGYCREAGLEWIEDPSNRSSCADRNFLRHHILPDLRKRWPGLDHSVLRSGRLSGQAAGSLALNLRPLLASALKRPGQLDGGELEALCDLELGEMIRIWARDRVGEAPPGKPLDEFLRQVRQADGNQTPQLRWNDTVIRYWNRHFWLDSVGHSRPYDLDWHTSHALSLPDRLGTMQISGRQGPPALELRVRSGQAGERLKTATNESTHRVKELLRTHGVPPWQRERWPRLCDGDRLLAVGDQWVDHAFADWLHTHQLELQWDAVESVADRSRQKRHTP